jgi:DNA-3-methyladenine glycosylase I
VQNDWALYKEHAPASTPASDALSKALKSYGCKFVGSTICYAFMQAVGMVNDHQTNCASRERCAALAKRMTETKPTAKTPAKTKRASA